MSQKNVHAWVCETCGGERPLGRWAEEEWDGETLWAPRCCERGMTLSFVTESGLVDIENFDEQIAAMRAQAELGATAQRATESLKRFCASYVGLTPEDYEWLSGLDSTRPKN